MYQISSKTGMRHVVNADMPDNLSALKMLRGTELPAVQCNQKIQPVNFYKPDYPCNPRWQCKRCFS